MKLIFSTLLIVCVVLFGYSASSGWTSSIPQDILKKCPSKYITALTHGNNGNIYIGTEGHGLLELQKNTKGTWEFKNTSLQPGFPNTKNIYALCRDLQGRIWVGTDNCGTAVFNGKQWKVFNRINGPKGERIFSIQCSHYNGDIAIGHSAGLAVYMPKKKQWIHISKWNGLPATQVQSVGFSPGGGHCGSVSNAEASPAQSPERSTEHGKAFKQNGISMIIKHFDPRPRQTAPSSPVILLTLFIRWTINELSAARFKDWVSPSTAIDGHSGAVQTIQIK